MESALRGEDTPQESEELNELLTDGCARMLTLETERLRLSARISELAADAHEPDAAQELRRLWARRREIVGELGELRNLLGRLGATRRGALA